MDVANSSATSGIVRKRARPGLHGATVGRVKEQLGRLPTFRGARRILLVGQRTDGPPSWILIPDGTGLRLGNRTKGDRTVANPTANSP